MITVEEGCCMAGKLDGSSYGNVGPGIDPKKRAIGEQVRKFRVQNGMSLTEVAEAMTRYGHRWNRDTVSMVQTGRDRALSVPELYTLCQIFNVSADRFLNDAFGD